MSQKHYIAYARGTEAARQQGNHGDADGDICHAALGLAKVRFVDSASVDPVADPSVRRKRKLGPGRSSATLPLSPTRIVNLAFGQSSGQSSPFRRLPLWPRLPCVCVLNHSHPSHICPDLTSVHALNSLDGGRNAVPIPKSQRQGWSHKRKDLVWTFSIMYLSQPPWTKGTYKVMLLA
ncbi:hypothetical protein L228DRAFT_241638 [Xylona heveae TC161]|uniref:Uncharacterized protein n=1 Tax=Xylona heveae (strain CBS 132557 / TC161) TaxID=1328760 RepID=A0A164ZR22_XYLHT|nr:hypothetical protein L228DRAFT_241638 [Xylona heveae TC161]KZF19400.1 hypothetical protein L228DRAFT_241638 [Xylona heveae TC161]